jgi:MFS family permease
MDFSIDAATLGNLSAFYFYSYVAMQIPTGLLADSWGPRRLLTAGTFVACAGSLMFALSDSMAWAMAGRLLVGGSVAVAWVVLLKLSDHWMPARLYAMVSGLALLCGILGAVAAGTPLRLLVDAFGWRPVMFWSGMLVLFLTAAIWLFVRDDPSERGYLSYSAAGGAGKRKKIGSPLAGLGRVFKYWNTWMLVLAPGGIVGPVLAFTGLWGVPFLQVRYGLPPSQGAAVCSLMMVAWAAGGPVLGGLSDRIGRRKPLYLAGNITAVLGWALVIFVKMPLPLFLVAAAVTGFSCGGMIIGFAFGKESVPGGLSGTVSGVVNTGVMTGPMVLQPLIGWVLDLSWDGRMAGGVRVYDAGDFQAGFSVMLVWTVLSCLLLAMTRETHCRPLAAPEESAA